MAAKKKIKKVFNRGTQEMEKRRGPDLKGANADQVSEIKSLMNQYGRQSRAGDIFTDEPKAKPHRKGKSRGKK